MQLGKVIGTIWATRKYETLTGNSSEEEIGSPIIAIDTIGAGPGEIIYYITASEAVIPLNVEMAPVDASIVGIVDSLYSEQ